jgi:hypothetical protein
MAEESILRADTQRVYEGRLPRLAEVLLWGGKPGVEYCYVDGANLGAFQSIGFELVRDTDAFTVTGPKGECSSVVIMGRGTPIPGADPQNGIRVLGVDNKIRESTGLDSEEGYDAFLEDEKTVQQGQAEESAPPPEAA